MYQPAKKPFDYEEYLTRLADRKAADPEYQKRVDAFKQRKRARWDKIKEQRNLAAANREMAEEVKRGEAVGVSRIRNIWHCVIDDRNEKKWRQSPTLSQASRIACAPRVRGVGRAAAKAGF